MDSEKLKFLSMSTVYGNNNGSIVVRNIPKINPTLMHIYGKYDWFR